jgi:Condensation domain
MQRYNTLQRLEGIPRDVADLSLALRPLGSFERLFWLIDQSHPVHFAVTAEVECDISPRDWRQALDRVQDRHPLLNVSIEGAPGRVPYYRREQSAPIPLRIVEDDDPGSRWKVEVGEELATPFDPSEAPLARAVLIQGRHDAAFILLAHHSIADGMSLAFAIRDTLQAMAGGALEKLSLPASQDAILRSTEIGNGMPREDEQAAPAGPASTMRQRDDARPHVQGLSFSKTLTEKLRERAREERTTVHAALLAALGIAGRRVSAAWRDIPIRLSSAVNARGELGVGDDCGVFVGAASSTLDPEVYEFGAAGFWGLARRAKSSVANGQTKKGIAAVVSALREAVGNCPDVAEAAEFAAATFAREAMLTNLGAVPLAGQFGALKLKALWGPAVLQGLVDEQTIGVATVAGTLTLTHTSYTPYDGLLQETQNVLVEACA